MTTATDRQPTQAELLLELLRERGERGVTPIVALERIGSFRLAARVSDLKAQGHTITNEWWQVEGGPRVARYVLHEQPAQLGLAL